MRRRPGVPAPPGGRRALYRLLDVLTDEGVQLQAMQGPWGVWVAGANRRGRPGRRALVYVERGHTRIQVDSEARARLLAGFLNWCEVEERELR